MMQLERHLKVLRRIPSHHPQLKVLHPLTHSPLVFLQLYTPRKVLTATPELAP